MSHMFKTFDIGIKSQGQIYIESVNDFSTNSACMFDRRASYFVQWLPNPVSWFPRFVFINLYV